MVKNAIKKFLGIDEIKSRVDNFEQRLGNVEIQLIQMKGALNQFGNFKNQTPEVLRFMKRQIEDLRSSVQALIDGAESDEILKEAKAVRKRLKNQETRTHNALRAIESGG